MDEPETVERQIDGFVLALLAMVIDPLADPVTGLLILQGAQAAYDGNLEAAVGVAFQMMPHVQHWNDLAERPAHENEGPPAINDFAMLVMVFAAIGGNFQELVEGLALPGVGFEGSDDFVARL